MVGAVEGEQSGLESNEGDGVARTHGATHDAAGVGLEAARHVDRKYRCAKPVERSDPFRVTAGHLALQADAEYAVYYEPPVVRCRKRFGNRSAGRAPREQGV